MFEAETTTTTTITQKNEGQGSQGSYGCKAKETDWNFFGNLPVISMFAEEVQQPVEKRVHTNRQSKNWFRQFYCIKRHTDIWL